MTGFGNSLEEISKELEECENLINALAVDSNKARNLLRAGKDVMLEHPFTRESLGNNEEKWRNSKTAFCPCNERKVGQPNYQLHHLPFVLFSAIMHLKPIIFQNVHYFSTSKGFKLQ